jgi:hypothetical protein
MCQDLDILAKRFDAESIVYAEAVHFLQTAAEPHLIAASRRVERALLAFERAREQLSQHLRLHQCSQAGD